MPELCPFDYAVIRVVPRVDRHGDSPIADLGKRRPWGGSFGGARVRLPGAAGGSVARIGEGGEHAEQSA